jgi:ABC-type proline/glycine betaine transport system permease subunit
MTLADTANLHTFVDAFRFIGDNPSFLAHRALEQLELSGAALAIAIGVALPLGIILGHLHRGDRGLDRRPCAAEHRPDRGVPDHPRDRLRQ